MLKPGFRLGPYEIHAPLALGPGETYRAYDHAHKQPVTVHVFPAVEQDRWRRFEVQVCAAAALSHPHILEPYDFGTHGDATYVVSGLCSGGSLRARLQERALSLGDPVRWSFQIARALAAARRHGVRHRHLSADHVAIDRAGRAVVLGFGLASVAQGHRPSSDAAALVRLTGAMLRAGWQAVPRLRRFAWTTVLLLVGAIGVGVMSMSYGARDRGTVATADTAATPAAAPPVPEPPEAAPPVPVIPFVAPAANAPVATASAALLVVPARRDVNIVDARAVPAPPSPVAPPVETPAPAARPAAPARPLTPVVADGRDATSLMTEASVRATEFDLAGAYELSSAAAKRGDAAAQIAAPYIRGLLEARDAFRDGGPLAALAPVREAIGSLERIAKGRPGAAEIARLTLHAAAAAAQSERDEMSLYLETALEMESLQQTAGLPGAPLVSAAEVAGDLWLQVHRYEDARRAYAEAAARGGSTLRVLSGLARTARRLNDAASACASYRRLLEAWGGRPGLPVEIAEARAYVGGCAQ